MGSKGTRYSEEVKAGANKLVVENGRAVQAVSTDLGIAEQTLHRWLGKNNKKDDNDHVRLKQLEAEIKQLKKDKVDLEDTVEILKKSCSHLCSSAEEQYKMTKIRKTEHSDVSGYMGRAYTPANNTVSSFLCHNIISFAIERFIGRKENKI